MLFGGIIIQVLIQAAILQLSLKLIAKYEADTSFSKAIMVTAGITVGNFLVILLLGKICPLLIWPAQIALTAAVIMTFCWISFWKSVIVVLVFVTVQVIFALILFFAFGISMLAMIASSTGKGPARSPLDYKHPVEVRDQAMRKEYEAMQHEAQRMQQKALHKQASIEAEVRRMEMEENTTPHAPPQRSFVPPPPPQDSTTRKTSRYDRRYSSNRIDWEGAESSLRMGGIIAGAKGYLAMINGVMVKEGDTVKANFNSREYSWRVKKVTKTDVELEKAEVNQFAERAN